MSKLGAFLSGIAGIAVLVGYFIPNLNTIYYLIPIGGVLAILSAIIIAKSRTF